MRHLPEAVKGALAIGQSEIRIGIVMYIDFTHDEIVALRSCLIGDRVSTAALSQDTRERLVLKLHFALEQTTGDEVSEPTHRTYTH